jgi:pimeloyl-ACP methyl ester carboxylesterase
VSWRGSTGILSLTIISIIFVHGLTGSYRSTWTEKSSNIFWPKDLLAKDDLPPTRIWSYGYDAHIAHFWAMTSQNGIYDHASNLVNELSQERERTDTMGRPIIFVAHSLGGLVVEDALLYSKNSVERHLQDIFHSVSGICFLGTPHCGSDYAKWGSILGSFVKVIKNANVKLVNLLTRDSEVLSRVQQEFHKMVRGSANGKNLEIGITCFFEELPIRSIGEVRDVLMLAKCVLDLMIPPNRSFPNILQYSHHILLSAFTPIMWTWQGSAASRIQDTALSVVRYDDG